MKGIPNSIDHLEEERSLGTPGPTFWGNCTLRGAEAGLLVWTPSSVLFLTLYNITQLLGLRQLRHQKCHISYDNTICYITGAAEQARGRSHEHEPQCPPSGSRGGWVPHTWQENSAWEGHTHWSTKGMKTRANICITVSMFERLL